MLETILRYRPLKVPSKCGIMERFNCSDATLLLSLLACACAAAQDNFLNFTINGTVPPNAMFATTSSARCGGSERKVQFSGVREA
jgi:hypothetical protein